LRCLYLGVKTQNKVVSRKTVDSEKSNDVIGETNVFL
jgi:hypothetical protein